MELQSLLTNGPVALEQLERDVAEYLEKLGLHNPEVSARTVDRLERTPGVAKLKRFVQLTSNRPEMASTPSVMA